MCVRVNSIRLGREKDSGVCGSGCRQSGGNRCGLGRDGLLFRQYDQKLLNLTLLVWSAEAGLCHGEILPHRQPRAQVTDQ